MVVSAPDMPVVNPVPGITNETEIQVSGTAEAFSIVMVYGGSFDVSTTVPDSGLFSLVFVFSNT